MFENKGLCDSLIEHCSDIITILKTDGTIIFQSTSIRRLLGYEPDELIGKNAFQMVSPDDLPRVMDAFTQVVQTPLAHLSVEYGFKHKDGSWRMIESTGSNQLNNRIDCGDSGQFAGHNQTQRSRGVIATGCQAGRRRKGEVRGDRSCHWRRNQHPGQILQGAVSKPDSQANRGRGQVG
ncbi:MAG: PAS domain-containing protein [Comamonadaceae bacterium]|nr:PAS domain-containing protein [Comamonadaceae bacterium]